jgi:hypothetical protein
MISKNIIKNQIETALNYDDKGESNVNIKI